MKNLKKVLIISIVLALCAFSISALYSQEKEAGEYIQIADQFLKEKNYREALVNYKSALLKNSGSVKANLGFAKSSLYLGSQLDAETGFKRTLELDSKNKEAIAGLAEIQADLGKFKEAIDILSKSLKEEPYSPELLLARISVLLKAGNNKLALKKLEEAKKRLAENYEFKLLMTKVYIANKKFKKANYIIDELIAKYPENPNSFNQKAVLNFEMINESKDQKRLMKETYSLLQTALSLDGNNFESKRLLIKNLLWLAKYEPDERLNEAKKYTNELLIDFPNDPSLQYFSGYINDKLKQEEESAENYIKLLELQELNELGRFSAETYSIEKLNELHNLRTDLGKYRLDQYLLTKKEYLYNEALFHLRRAEKLIPSNNSLRRALLEYYYTNGDLYNILLFLTKLRNENIEDMKIHNRLENVFHKFKQTLVYREGFTDRSGRIDPSIRSETEIFVFDPEPETGPFSYPDASLQIGSAIKFAFSLEPSLKLISNEEENKIRNRIQEKKGKEPYTESIYYRADSLDFLDFNRKRDNIIRYIVYGTFKEDKTKITVKYKLYDRTSGKIITQINASASNRNSLSEIAMRVAKRISAVIPLDARIIKIKPDRIIVNIGAVDGIKKNHLLESISLDGNPIRMKVVSVDAFVSEAIPETIGWNRNVSLKDKVIISGNKN